MDAALQLIGQQIIDQAMAGDPALPLEGFSYNINPEMRLFSPLVPGVASMLIGFVENPQAHRSEGFGQLL
jgi:hypothetical protein